MKEGTLTPAFGRDYKSKKAVEEDFRAGKDFVYNNIRSVWDGKLCSIRDCSKGDKIKIRYKKKTMITIITV